jgi:uncharacterized membrane protein (DUF106 family)
MGIFSFLDPVLNTIFGPLLNIPPFWSILIISAIVSLIITLCYKWFTDQDLMKRLKTEMKELQKEMKELKNHPEKAMAVQKKAMETNMKYMGNSMKPTLVTFIPIILIFGWLNAHLAYEPILPNQPFTVSMQFGNHAGEQVMLHTVDTLELLVNNTQIIGNKEATWRLQGPEGNYLLTFEYQGTNHTKDLLITTEKEYAAQLERVAHSDIKSVQIHNNKVKVLFGLSWLWSYIIFSIILSTLLRKLLKIY